MKPIPPYGEGFGKWKPNSRQELHLSLLKSFKKHMNSPDVQHVQSWHEKDLSKLKKESIDLAKEEMFSKKELGDVNTYILGKDELEKPRELSEEEKNRINLRKRIGWTLFDPLVTNQKMDATQIIQNPIYRGALNTVGTATPAFITGTMMGAGLVSLLAKKPSLLKTLGTGLATGTLAALPSTLNIHDNYKKQKLYNDITEEFIKHHPEGQITTMPTILKDMLDKPRSVSKLKLDNKKIVKKSDDQWEHVYHSREKGFEKMPWQHRVGLRIGENPYRMVSAISGGLNLPLSLYEGFKTHASKKQEYNDLKDRFEQRMKKKREAEVFLTKVKTPIYKKHHGQKEKIKDFDNLFKTSVDKEPLLEHQKRVVERLSKSDQPGLILMHGLGSGKTRSSIEAYKSLGLPTEAIVPAALKGNFEKELHKWVGKHPKDLDITSQQEIARNGLPEHALDGKLMIVDEAHRLRNEDTKLYKNLKTQNPAKRLLLSGTPIYNNPSDISKLINLAAGKDILPERKPEFEQEYIGQRTVFPTLVHRMLGVSPGQEQYVKNPEYLKKVFHKLIDYHAGNSEGFPDVKEERINVPMGKDQQHIYKALMKDLPWYLRLKVSAGLPPDKKELDKLIPFLSGARMISNSTSGFKKDNTEIESPKIDKAVEYLKQKMQEDPEYKGVVYSNYLNNGVNEYKHKLDEAKIPYGEFTGEINEKKRNQLVKDYNANKIKALLLSSAGGEGLDLRGTRLIQILEPHFNNPKVDQVIGRAARYKSHEGLAKDKQNVLVQRYFSTLNPGMLDKLRGKKPTSSDEYLQNLADQKTQLNNEFINLIKN